MAMIRQLGMPSLFLTFSAAETWWPELLISLYYEKYGKSLTFDDVAKMTWAEKVGLIRENPVTTARHFDHRFRNYFNLVVKPVLGYNDSEDDYFLRVEFQNRGSPHVHMIIWHHVAPKYKVDDTSQVCQYIDKYITVDLPGNSIAEIPQYLLCQFHSHTLSCKKKTKRSVDFTFPKNRFLALLF